MEFWFTPKRWITGVRSQAASIIEALGLSCVAVLHTSFLEARLPPRGYDDVLPCTGFEQLTAETLQERQGT